MYVSGRYDKYNIYMSDSLAVETLYAADYIQAMTLTDPYSVVQVVSTSQCENSYNYLQLINVIVPTLNTQYVLCTVTDVLL